MFLPQTPGESSAAGFWAARSLGSRCCHAPSFERHPSSLSEALMAGWLWDKEQTQPDNIISAMHAINLIIISPLADSTYKTEGNLGSARQSICLSPADHISVLPLSLLFFHLPHQAFIKTMVLIGLGKYTSIPRTTQNQSNKTISLGQ